MDYQRAQFAGFALRNVLHMGSEGLLFGFAR
jgi:hypothetical protein